MPNKLLTADPSLDRYIVAAADAYPIATKHVKDTLDLIKANVKPTGNAQALQLLALRRYVRMGGAVVQKNWAWTDEEARRFAQQGTFKLLQDEATKVQAIFAAANPGYTLLTSPLRNLKRQVRCWDSNNAVQRAADGLQSYMLAYMQETRLSDVPTRHTLSRFVAQLKVSAVRPEPTSAAPGLSDHGQMRAVDFVVRGGGRIVATTDTSTIKGVWQAGGWEAKLIAAASQTKLIGPLKNPYEPWHWRLPHA
jgi:hypothetical protein